MGNYFRRVRVWPLLTLITIATMPTGFAASSKIEPSDVIGLKVVFLAKDQSKIILTWKANPKSEEVDKYAVYALNNPQTDFHPAAPLLGITKGQTMSVKLTFVTSNSLFSKAGLNIVQGPNHGRNFWVVAHNGSGWGENDTGTKNPDGNWSRDLNRTGHMHPNFLYLEFPCTPAGIKANSCLKD